MNDKNIKKDTHKKNGFYFALYSVMAVMLVSAVVLGYFNLNKSAKNPIPEINDSISDVGGQEDAAEVNNAKDPAFPLYDGEIGQAFTGIEDSIIPNNNDSLVIAKKPAATPTPAPEPSPSPKSAPTPAPAVNPPEALNEDENENERASDADAAQPDNGGAASAESQDDKPEIEALEDNPEKNDFSVFNESSTMEWPLVGEIVMPFSMDSLVYDKTLEQFRPNNNICISAPSGTQVMSAADGIVTEVYKTTELGNTIVINHGNGWETTYSQLQDDILVSVDDVVKAGQVIGEIGEPSRFSVNLGSHLNFEVLKDEVPIDPNNVLVSR